MRVFTRFFRVVPIAVYVITNFATAQLGARSTFGPDVNETSRTLLAQSTIHHYEYVFPDGYIYVYDTDNNFQLVKTISVPTSSGTRGAVANAATGMLYISYGPDGCCDGSLLKYDLTGDQIVWTRTYSFGIDSMSISPDGQTIYMPTGENNPGGLWEVINTASGDVTGVIDSGGVGPHNTVLNASGTHLYMGPRGTNYLVEADTSTLNVIRQIGPIASANGPGVRPFTINGAETLAFITATGLLGFQVADIATGSILYQVPINGFSWDGSGGITAPSHGISISPDNRELYMMDSPNSYVHVFDIGGLPGSAPVQVADIPLVGKMSGSETGCAYDCGKDGWLQHSRNGHYVFVGDSGDVIDTGTRNTVTTLPTLSNTRDLIEVDFQNGVPVWAMGNRSSTGTLGTTSQRRAYPAVWRPATGVWFINGSTPVTQQWGSPGDIPVPGDYDGDGKTDFAVWSPSTGIWWIIPSSNPANIVTQQWGSPGDIPVPGDYDGDGKTDFAVWTPYTGNWWVIPSSNPANIITPQWGSPDSVPVPSDFDGDGKTDFAVWDPSDGLWHIILSTHSENPVSQQWGMQGDIPLRGRPW